MQDKESPRGFLHCAIGHEKLVAETIVRLAAPGDPLALLFITGVVRPPSLQTVQNSYPIPPLKPTL
jgi:hypothetical protein